jgi:hypothetical protein
LNSQLTHFTLQRGDNIKRLRREANAEVVIEDFVVGSEERVLSVVLHRDAPHHTSMSGGDALVAVFEAFVELSRDCLTANNSSEEVDMHTNGSDGDAQMTITGIHDDGDAEIRLLVDSSRKFFLNQIIASTIIKVDKSFATLCTCKRLSFNLFFSTYIIYPCRDGFHCWQKRCSHQGLDGRDGRTCPSDAKSRPAYVRLGE